MSFIRRIHLQILVASFLISPGLVSAVDFSVDAHAGTLGTGIGGTVNLIKHFNLRVGINSSEIKLVDIDEEDGLVYDDPTLEFDNKYILVDFYPWRRGKFRVSAGLILNDNIFSAGATVVGNNTLIGGASAPDGTSIAGEVSFASTSGYFGVGWGNSVGRGLPIGFGVDVGLMSQGEASASLVINDPTNTVTAENAELERQDLEDEFDSLDLWPVINLSVSYRF